MKLSDIARLLALPSPTRGDEEVTILLTDSRSLTFPDKTLFFALVTPRGDGHHYIKSLYDRGVRAFVVDREMGGKEECCREALFLHVRDTKKALQQVAKAHRESFSLPLVGITGSNGKTTFKEMCYQLLAPRMKVVRSPRSYNSSIGVPLSLWGIQPHHEVALIEAGISLPGEMNVLAEMIKPTIGVFTNLGEAHQENFSSLKEKCREKLSLFSSCHHIVASIDNPIVTELLKEEDLFPRLISWSRKEPSADFFLHSLESVDGAWLMRVLYRGRELSLRVPFQDEGSVNSFMLSLGLLSLIAPDLLENPDLLGARLLPLSMRLEVIEGEEGMQLINDTYNSDYDSLSIALDFLLRRNTESRPMALVLSDIEGSGLDSPTLYKRVGDLVGRYALSHLYLVGPEISENAHFFSAPTSIYETTQAFLSDLLRDGWGEGEGLRERLRGHLVLLKGARTARFERIVEVLRRHTHQTILDVNLSAIVHNLEHYRSAVDPNTRFVCMVKAFGYGAGSYEIAKTLADHHVDYLAVAVADEGQLLREKGIDLPIIVMNPDRSSFTQIVEHRLQPEVYSMSLLEDFVEFLRQWGEESYPIHIKWDTGMHRLGFMPEDLEALLSFLAEHDEVRVISTFTHLSVADDPLEDAYTLEQLACFDRVTTALASSLPYPVLRHALNTAGITRFPGFSMEMVRLGLGLYGLSPCGEASALRPATSLSTLILQVRDLPQGATVGYGRRGVLERPSRVGVIPVGYADGLPRLLGNGRASFRSRGGQMLPTIGNVCMDMMMLDLTDAPEVGEGDRVVIFDETLPLERLAQACETISYEILAGLSPRIIRRYYKE